VVILAWNFKDEIMAQLAHIRRWGGKFIVPIPQASVVDPPAEVTSAVA